MYLLRVPNPALVALNRQCRSVNGFNQAGAKSTMHLDRRADRPSGRGIDTLQL
jgi:hypothetical protein